MISVKSGTKTWSDAPQQSSLKTDSNERISASAKADQLGGQEVGEILNKISDPNWVDPAKRARQVGKSELDKDAFLNLLLAQMKNQDPTNPLKSHEMAAQLAQFTSLEKLSAIDKGIENLAKSQTPNKNFEALNFIGKMVAGDGAKIQRTENSEGHDIKFNIMNDATTCELKVVNESGEVVRTLQVNSLKAGKNQIYWNGSLEDGTEARPGEYTVEINATGSNGAKLHTETQFQGKITGVNFTARGPVLLLGKQTIAMSDVTEIIDPNVKTNAHDLSVPTLGDKPLDFSQVQKAAAKPEDGKVSVPAKSNLENIPMARDMMNKLSKQGAETGM